MKESKVAPLIMGETLEFITRKIELSVEKEGFNLKAEGYSEDFLLNLVANLRDNDVVAQVVHKPSVLAPNAVLDPEYIKNTVEEVKAVKEAPSTVKVEAPQVEVNKPVYSTGNATDSTLAEKFGGQSKDLYKTAGVEHKPSETDYYHTGIKYDSTNRPKYRCSYECPKCGGNGRHYIPTHVPRISCHNCNTPLVTEPATELGIGTTEDHRDANGNFFVAEVIDYSVARWDKSGK